PETSAARATAPCCSDGLAPDTASARSGDIAPRRASASKGPATSRRAPVLLASSKLGEASADLLRCAPRRLALAVHRRAGVQRLELRSFSTNVPSRFTGPRYPTPRPSGSRVVCAAIHGAGQNATASLRRSWRGYVHAAPSSPRWERRRSA